MVARIKKSDKNSDQCCSDSSWSEWNAQSAGCQSASRKEFLCSNDNETTGIKRLGICFSISQVHVYDWSRDFNFYEKIMKICTTFGEIKY